MTIRTKFIYIVSFLILSVFSASSQAHFIVSKDTYLHGKDVSITFQDVSLVNNGFFTSSNSKVRFSGDTSSGVTITQATDTFYEGTAESDKFSYIGGSNPLNFYDMEVMKTSPSLYLRLGQTINVDHHLIMTRGKLDLFNHDINLKNSGDIINETNENRILDRNMVGGSGLLGQIIRTATIPKEVDANPGNLGLGIRSRDIETTYTIKRGHDNQVNQELRHLSIMKYFDVITTEKQENLNAIINFNYFDDEVNQSNFEKDATFDIYRSEDGGNTWERSFASPIITNNSVTDNEFNQFNALITVSSELYQTLPLNLIEFVAGCKQDMVILDWSTEAEYDLQNFIIQRSRDGEEWIDIEKLSPKGNIVSTKNEYSITDRNIPSGNIYYRLKIRDTKNNISFSQAVSVKCIDGYPDIITLYPNPVERGKELTVSVLTTSPKTLSIQLIEPLGRRIEKNEMKVVEGNNLFSIPLSSQLPIGIYTVRIGNYEHFTTQKITIK